MDAVKNFRKELGEKAFVSLTQSDLVKLHAIQLDMLRDFIGFCEKHDIVYYFTGGSALGAIRHKGFIPWDDDIDIVVPRSDYNVLLASFEDEFPDKYYVEAPNGKHVGFMQMMKIKKKGTVLRELISKGPEYGVFVDVFPLEYAPASKIHQKCCEIGYFLLKSLPYSVAFYMLYDSIFRPYEKECSPRLRFSMRVKRIWGKLLSKVSTDKWLNGFDRMVQKKTSCYYVVPSGIHRYSDECFPVDYFYPPRKVEFEGLAINVPNKIESILTCFYGDYMTPPPPAEISAYAHYFLAVDLGDECLPD